MKKIVFLLFLIVVCQYSFSQDSIKRPKIGLVLSGGGAKGFAHIGVIKVLEQAGVKIDFIGGTSMGAVIAGLYASGYTGAQLDSIVTVTSFDNLLLDYIPRTSKNFYEKRNSELYAFELPFNNFKIEVPQSLSKGMFNYNLFNRLTLHVRHIRDFNKLPIPFLCITTDIEKGEQVILDKGVLSQALIASSALPTVFSPVLYDGKMLIDGGVINNYPIEEIKKLGADIIIGVDVQTGLRDREHLKDATKILFQITNLDMIEKMKANSKNTNIYIQPHIEDIGIVSFEKAKEIMLRGEEAAFTVYEEFKEISKNSGFNVKPKLKKESDSLHIINIIDKNFVNFSKTYLEGKLRIKKGSKISYKDLETGINNLDATQNFASILYSLEKNGNGDDLVLDLVENPNKTYLKFGLHYDGIFKSGVLVNVTNKNTFFKNDVMSFDFIVGDNVRYNFDYYKDNGYNISLGFKSQFNQFTKNFSNKLTSLNPDLPSQSINIDFLQATNQIYFQTIFAQKFLMGFGVEHKYLYLNSKTSNNTNNVIDNCHYGSAFARLKYDSFDSQYFPTKGWYLAGDMHNYLLATKNPQKFIPFSIINADFGIAFKVFKKATFKLQSEGGVSIGVRSVPFFDFALGGYGYTPINNFKPFYGYDFLTLVGDSYLKASFVFDYEIFKKNHLNLAANYANIQNNLFDTLNWLSLPQYSGYALGYGLETALGPISVKYSWSPETNKGFTWFSVGYYF